MRILPALLLLCAIAMPAAAQYCDTNNSCLFPPGPCAYLGAAQTVTFPNGWQLNYLDQENSIDCAPFPAVGGDVAQTIHSTGVIRLLVNGVPNLMGGQSTMIVRVIGDPGSNPSPYTLEMLSLVLAVGAGVEIRESPTLASTGHATVQEGPPGQFHIESFFDVFFELSSDSGQSWMPADRAMHVVLSPSPPLPAHNTTWGGVKAIYR